MKKHRTANVSGQAKKKTKQLTGEQNDNRN